MGLGEEREVVAGKEAGQDLRGLLVFFAVEPEIIDYLLVNRLPLFKFHFPPLPRARRCP